MTKEQFHSLIAADPVLQRRFVTDPHAILAEFQVETELSEEELDLVCGGSAAESRLVHSLLTSIFDANPEV